MSAALSVVVFGRRSILSRETLEEVSRRHRVVGVVESHFRGFQPERGWRKWIKRIPRRVDIKRFATDQGIPYFLLTPERIDQLIPFLQSLNPDVGVIACLVQLLPPRVIALFPLGILNGHPSLLPEYRGPDPIFWMYYHAEMKGGVTIHFIDEGEDTGDRVKQASLPIAFGELGKHFIERCAHLMADLMGEALDDLAKGQLQRTPQRHLVCPVRARMTKSSGEVVPWADWSIERSYHLLRGAMGTDLLPPRSFPLSLFEWQAIGYERGGAPDGRLRFHRAGWRYCFQLPQGRVWFRPRFSIERIRWGLKQVLNRR